MSHTEPFVKHVNTTYGGSLLGHSQDVGIERGAGRPAIGLPGTGRELGDFFPPQVAEEEAVLLKSK